MAEPLLILSGIRKSFGEVAVLHGVDLKINAGEVHTIVGENGAGKSTLMKIAAGLHRPDSGRMAFNGGEYAPKNPYDAHRLGIAMVHQELSLAPDVSVAENIFIGREPRRGWAIDWKELNRQASRMLSDFCLAIDPATSVSSLNVGYRQVIEILKALVSEPKVIIFDEPTSSLEAQETALVLETILKLKEHSIGVAYISHRMDDVFRISDRISVLRDGVLVDSWEASNVTREQVISAMVGRELTEMYPTKTDKVDGEILRVSGFTRQGSFQDISFSLKKGEILGFSGLVGSGRTELMRSIFAAEPADSGSLIIAGEPRKVRSIKDALDTGIAYLPEDRKTQGLFLERSLEDNIACGNLKRCSKGPFIQSRLSHSISAEYCGKLAIKASGIDQEVKNLSGGNQQKVLFARLMAMEPQVLIVDEPTRGVDVGAKGEIHRLLRDYANAGHGVIVVSSEMPEIIGLCDRVVVLHEGRVAGEISGSDITEEKLINLAVGGEPANR